MSVTSHSSAQADLGRSSTPFKRHADAMPSSPDSGALWAVSPLIALVLAVSAAAWSLPAQAASDPQPTFTERVRDNVRGGAQAVGDYSSDALITTKVKAALVANGDVKALDVNVSTKNGVVHLEGDVDTPEQRATAERLAGDVADVRSVENRLGIKRR